MFYAFFNSYGNGTTDDCGERLGTLHAFATKRERDEWVEADRFDGAFHRETIDSRDARHELRDAYLCETGKEPLPSVRAMLKELSALYECGQAHLIAFH